MYIAEKRLRKIIRSVILENEVHSDMSMEHTELVDDAINLIKGNRISSLEESMSDKMAGLGKTLIGMKMTAPLLASLVIGLAHLKGVPVESLAAGAVDMASEITRLLGITDSTVIELMINTASGLAGASLAASGAKQAMK